MVCPNCDYYYECKGEVCLKEGQLDVAFNTGVKKEKIEESSFEKFPKETREERNRHMSVCRVMKLRKFL